MNRVRRTGVLFAWALIAASLLARPANAAAVDDAAILPYLDEGTFVVVRLDVERVDHEAFGKYLEQSIDAMFKMMPVPEDQRGMVKAQVMASLGTVKTFLTDIAAAGGKHMYVLFDVADLRAGNEEPVVVIPIGADGDAGRVREIIGRDNEEPENIHEIGKAVVFANAGPADRLKNRMGAKPVELPDLARALAAAGDAPLRVALVPSEASRAWVEENLPELPEQLGGGDTKVLSRGVRYASVGITQKPATMANLTIRCADADKAKAVLEVINKGVASLKPAPAADEEGEKTEKKTDKNANTLKPKLAGDTITVSVDPVVLMMQLNGMQATGDVEVEADVDKDVKVKIAEPAKKDDGGL